jgi:hypothetical protein
MAEHHKIAAAKRAAARKKALSDAVDQAMRTIVVEMKANEGIYPHNGGAVSRAELARRAGIDESSFYKPQNKDLKERTTLWLQQLQKKETIGRKRVRKHIKDVARDWKERYEALDRQNILTHLKMQKIEAEMVELEKDIQTMREQLTARPSNVAFIAKKSKG